MEQPGVPLGEWVRRYLRLLGLESEAPSPAALGRLTRAHLLTVPFGNVTALLRYGAHREDELPLPDLDDLLRQWEARRGTGACFEIAAAFSQLLTALGYEVMVVAGMAGSFLGGHQAIVVSFPQARYLVDVACGAPLFEPVPLDDTIEVRRAGLRYRFRPCDAPEEHLQERWRDGKWTRFCRYELREFSAAEREAAYRRLHTPIPGAVIGILRLVRCTETEVASLRTGELTQFTEGGNCTQRLADPGDYERMAAEVFGHPHLPIVEALGVLVTLGNAPQPG